MARNIENTLIVLDYLLNKTDVNHLTSELEIVNYALDTYGVSIDHRSICKLLKELKELNDKYPDKFPFVLESNGSDRPKYYIEQKEYTKEEIIAIASAIKNDIQTPIETSEELINIFLKNSLSQYQYPIFKENIFSMEDKNGKISNAVALSIKKINKAIDNKTKITYKFLNEDTNEQYTHYFYKIVYIDSEPVAIIIKDGLLISEFVKNIKIIRVEVSFHTDPRCRFKLSDAYHGQFNTPDEEIKHSITPSSQIETRTATFTFPNNPHTIELIEQSFKSFFHLKFSYYIGAGICFSSVTCKVELIVDWFTKYEIAKLVTVTGDDLVKHFLKEHYLNIMNKNGLTN